MPATADQLDQIRQLRPQLEQQIRNAPEIEKQLRERWDAHVAREMPQAVERVLEVANDHPLLTWQPTPGFAGFVSDDWRFVLLRAANQVGKTMAAAWVVAQDLIRHKRRRWRVYAPSREMSRNVIERYLYEFLQHHIRRGAYVEGQGFATKTVTLQNGSILQIKSYEDNVQTGAGDQLDGCWLDEVPKESHFREALARVTRRRGRLIVTCTPVDRPTGWFRDRVEPLEQDGSRRVWLAGHDRPQGVQWKQYVVPFTRDNVPWLDEETFQEQVEAVSADPRQAAQRLQGAWEGLTVDRIFSAFSSDNEVAFDDWRHERGWQLALGLDHGELAGNQVGVFPVFKGSRIHIVGEYIAPAAESYVTDAQGMVAVLAGLGLRVDQITTAVGDHNLGGVAINLELQRALREVSGRTMCEIENAWKGRGSRDYGFRVINYALARGDLTVSPGCRAVLDALANWRGTDKGDDKALSHAADALRYIVVRLLLASPVYQRIALPQL